MTLKKEMNENIDDNVQIVDSQETEDYTKHMILTDDEREEIKKQQEYIKNIIPFDDRPIEYTSVPDVRDFVDFIIETFADEDDDHEYMLELLTNFREALLNRESTDGYVRMRVDPEDFDFTIHQYLTDNPYDYPRIIRFNVDRERYEFFDTDQWLFEADCETKPRKIRQRKKAVLKAMLKNINKHRAEKFAALENEDEE